MAFVSFALSLSVSVASKSFARTRKMMQFHFVSKDNNIPLWSDFALKGMEPIFLQKFLSVCERLNSFHTEWV